MAPDLVSSEDLEVAEPQELDFLGWLSALDGDQPSEKPVVVEQKSTSDLIDQFIENDPQITKREEVKFFSHKKRDVRVLRMISVLCRRHWPRSMRTKETLIRR